MSQNVFDQSQYWIERHEKLRGDPRSVGNLATTLEQNQQGEEEFKKAIAVAARLLVPGRKSVVDMGCGYGRVAGSFIDAGFTYTGLDVSAEALAQAREREPRGTYKETDLLTWSSKRRFDVVGVFYVLVHFVKDDDWSRFLRQCMAAVKDGGYLFLADHYPAERQSAAHYVARPFSDYLPELEQGGFAIDDEMAKRVGTELPGNGIPRHFRFAAKRS
jgi:2-polyprenyl-3-methyl-5-hydroxy-6-metoxy-1,4-benzoquinol methylase